MCQVQSFILFFILFTDYVHGTNRTLSDEILSSLTPEGLWPNSFFIGLWLTEYSRYMY
jgi:hypothetical protein